MTTLLSRLTHDIALRILKDVETKDIANLREVCKNFNEFIVNYRYQLPFNHILYICLHPNCVFIKNKTVAMTIPWSDICIIDSWNHPANPNAPKPNFLKLPHIGLEYCCIDHMEISTENRVLDGGEGIIPNTGYNVNVNQYFNMLADQLAGLEVEIETITFNCQSPNLRTRSLRNLINIFESPVVNILGMQENGILGEKFFDRIWIQTVRTLYIPSAECCINLSTLPTNLEGLFIMNNILANLEDFRLLSQECAFGLRDMQFRGKLRLNNGEKEELKNICNNFNNHKVAHVRLQMIVFSNNEVHIVFPSSTSNTNGINNGDNLNNNNDN